MFEVGFTEIVLIFGIALLVLGPARLPKLAADLGRWAGRARSMARQLRTQLEQEVHFDPLATPPVKTSTGTGTGAAIHPSASTSPVATTSAEADPTARATPLQRAGDPPAPSDATTAAALTTPQQDGD